MGEFNRFVGGAKPEPFDLAFPPLRAKAAPFAGPRRAFCSIGRRQYQADAGSCTGHGYSAPVEGQAAALGADLQLCRMDIYRGARWIEGNGAETRDGGAFPSRVRAWLAEYGTVTEARKPYAPHEVTTWRPPVEWADDRALLAPVYEAMRNTSADIVAEVSNWRQVPICHAVDAQMLNLPADGVERGMTGGSLGGHCRSVVGYDLDRDFGLLGVGGVLVMNSWKGWGLPHPERATDARFAGYDDSFSWVPLTVIDRDLRWLNDTARLVKMVEVRP